MDSSSPLGRRASLQLQQLQEGGGGGMMMGLLGGSAAGFKPKWIRGGLRPTQHVRFEGPSAAAEYSELVDREAAADY